MVKRRKNETSIKNEIKKICSDNELLEIKRRQREKELRVAGDRFINRLIFGESPFSDDASGKY